LDRRFFCFTASGAILIPLSTQASVGSADALLSAALDRFYQTSLRESPETATSLGVDRGARAPLKSQLHDGSLSAVQKRQAITREQISTLQGIDRQRLSDSAKLDYDTILYDRTSTYRVDRQFAYGNEGGGAPYIVDQIDGAYVNTPDFLATQHTIATAADCEAYLSRLSAFARLMDQEIERVRHDADLGVSPPDFAVAGALGQMRTLATPAANSTLVSSLADRARSANIPGDWAARAGAVYEQQVVPALNRQIALLQTLQPKAVHEAGVWRLPDGDAYYAEALHSQNTSDMSPDEIHQLGLDLTRQLQADSEVEFQKLGMTQGSVADRYAALFRDPRFLYPDTDAGRAQEIAALNQLVLAMEARLPAYFGALPRAPLEIRRIPPATEAGQSTHYTAASLDGSRPGIYWLNMRDMGEVPFFDMPTTTFHEGVPGHHLQITLQNQSSLPNARKLLFFNAYVEGWALYAEQLSMEMGALDGHPEWKLGYLHDALLRAGRLVVDTGIHHKRWSREKAIAVLHETDGDPLALSGQEVERYACSPGQACGYMVGKVTLLRLRDRARKMLGPRFDIRTFHDALLLSGSMPLAVLETRVDAYIAANQAA
jgi:uncharacterized protein (DUF885 family)